MLFVLMCLEGESMAQSVAEAARTRPELSFLQRRELLQVLAAVGQMDLARSAWAHLLEGQGDTVENDIGLLDDFLHAGVEQWAMKRIQELIDRSAAAPLRMHRLRQMLAWLTAACGRSSRGDVGDPSLFRRAGGEARQ